MVFLAFLSCMCRALGTAVSAFPSSSVSTATFLDVVFALRLEGSLALDAGTGCDTEEVGAAVPASA